MTPAERARLAASAARSRERAAEAREMARRAELAGDGSKATALHDSAAIADRQAEREEALLAEP
jgi:hypothetical protein